jgi:hypothetical protein
MNAVKRIILGFVLLSAPVIGSAQAFGDGTNLVFLGFGLPPGSKLTQTYDPNPSYTTYKLHNYGTGILKYEHGMHKYFGIGLNLEYSAATGNYSYDYSNSLRYSNNVTHSVLGAYLRLNGHFPIGDKVDIYGGVGLGYLYTIDNITDNNPNASQNTSHKNSVLGFDEQVTLGARFMVKEGFGVFAEAGYATTACQVGVVLKF